MIEYNIIQQNKIIELNLRIFIKQSAMYIVLEKWSYCPQKGLPSCARIPEFSDMIVVFVSDGGVIKINHMFMGPCMICISGAQAAVLKIFLMTVFSFNM